MNKAVVKEKPEGVGSLSQITMDVATFLYETNVYYNVLESFTGIIFIYKFIKSFNHSSIYLIIYWFTYLLMSFEKGDEHNLVQSYAVLDWVNLNIYQMMHQSYLNESGSCTITESLKTILHFKSNLVTLNQNWETQWNTLCKNPQIGDEFHYLFECPTLDVERKLWYFRLNTLKINSLMNSTKGSDVQSCSILMNTFEWLVYCSYVLFINYCYW